MKRFIFLRHSAYHQPEGVPSAMLPHGLNPEGIEIARNESKTLVDYLKEHQEWMPKQIECSVLLRAYETAKIIQNDIKKEFSIDLPIVQSEQLVERKLGNLANLSVQQIEEVITKDERFDLPPKGWKSQSDYKLPYPGCESLLEAGKRVKDYILEECQDQESRIIIGHGASFRHAAMLMGILNRKDIPKLSMHYAKPLYFNQIESGWDLVHGAWKVRVKTDKID